VTLVKWKLNLDRLEIVLISMQDRSMVCAERTTGMEIFSVHPMVLLGDIGKWKLVSVHIEIVLVLAQEMCPVCAKRTIGMEIILGATDGTPT
jgi:hypothetical protein